MRGSHADDSDVGLREVIPSAEQFLIADGGERIAEAVTKVERGAMSPFAEAHTGLLRDGALLCVDGDELNPEVTEQRIEIAFAAVAESSDEDKTRFNR